jgi:hypothetical protein
MKGRKRKPFSLEWKQNIAKSHIGKKLTNEHKQKLAIYNGEKSYWYNKKHNKKSIKLMRYSSCKYVYIIFKNYNIYIECSLEYFCKQNKISPTSFRRMLKNKKRYKGFIGIKFKKEEFYNINIKEISLKYGINHKELKREIEKFKKERNNIS